MRREDLRFYSFRELKDLPREPNKYLIDGFLWENDHVILLGKDKSGKSILAIQMACALSCGQSFLGEYEIPEPMNVAYIQTEGKLEETVERLEKMTSIGGVHCNPDRLFLLSTHSWQLDTPGGYAILEALLNRQKIAPRVIFLDPLYMSMEGDLSDNKASRAMAKNIRKLGETFNSAVVLIHHAHRDVRNKDGDKIEEGDSSIMGSFVWKAFPDHVIMLRKRNDGVRYLSCDTQRGNRVIENMQLILHETTPLMFQISGTPDHMPYVNKVYEFIRNSLNPVCAQEIQKESGLSISAVRKSLMYLSNPDVNKLNKVNPGKRPTYYEVNKITELPSS